MTLSNVTEKNVFFNFIKLIINTNLLRQRTIFIFGSFQEDICVLLKKHTLKILRNN